MRIETKRLYIRQMTDDDFDLMSLIWRDWIPAFLRDDETACNGLCHKLWEDNMKDPVTLTGMGTADFAGDHPQALQPREPNYHYLHTCIV